MFTSPQIVYYCRETHPWAGYDNDKYSLFVLTHGKISETKEKQPGKYNILQPSRF